MIKGVIKELILYLLLLGVILLILTIVFYDSIPVNKVIPNTVAYNRPELLEKELDKTVDEIKPTIKTYKIEQEHLTQYEKNDSYNPGKVDPFSSYNGNPSKPSTNVGSGSNNNSGSNSGGGSMNSGESTSTSDTTSYNSGGAGGSSVSVINK